MRSPRRVVVVALLLLAASGSSASAAGAPAFGRWEARGAGGARLVFMVVGLGQRRYVAHLVAFCGARGEPEFDDWGFRSAVGRSNDVAELDSGGRFATGEVGGAKTLAGRLGRHDGVVRSHPYGLLGTQEVACPASAYSRLDAHYRGPAFRPDGRWRMIGSFPETRGEWRTYGGGTLLQWSGTFAAPAPPPVLHCQPVSFVRSIPLGAKGRVRDTYADALGATTRVRIRGYFSGSHAAGSYVGNFVLDPRYPCTSLGFWLADLIWRPRYELPSDRPGGKPLTDVEVPVSTPPKGPRAGPEPNTFRCDVRKPHRPYDPCRPYRRRGPGGGRIVWLRWGTTQHGGWGYRHIVARRGFSARTDRYIAATLARGRRDPKDRSRIFRRFKGHGRSCTFRVILGAAAKGIISAYRVDGSKQGNVSGCP